MVKSSGANTRVPGSNHMSDWACIVVNCMYNNTKCWKLIPVYHFPLSDMIIMDKFPTEVKLQIINFLPLKTVMVVMLVNKELWNLCQISNHWKHVSFQINHRNVKTLVENRTLPQYRFSSVQSVDLNTWYITPELTDKLIGDIASSKVKNIKLIGTYHGSWTLLCATMKKMVVVDTTSMYRVIRR
jgi:hypothetical protein